MHPASPGEFPGQSDPLIVFVHVPKTAGSTINAHLTEAGPGRDHCEFLLSDVAGLTETVRDSTWISGHVPYHRLLPALEAVTDRPLRLFTLIRSPKEQVMSHYNWLIEIFHRSPKFYGSHPDRVKEISEQLRSNDNDDPAVVVANLERYRGLFLDCQTKFVLGRARRWPGHAIDERLDRYEFVGLDRVDELLTVMLGTMPEQAARENTSRYHFDKAVFDAPEIEEYLHTFNQVDNRLYRRATQLRRRTARSA